MRFNSKAAHAMSLALVLLTASNAVLAQESKAPWEEFDKLISKSKAVTTLGPDLLGDRVDLPTGSLTFSNTDVSISGNNSLPVAVTRTFAVHGDQEPAGGPFGDWDLDIPNISGLFAPDWHDNRCTTAIPPSKGVSGSSTATLVGGTHYWKGNTANMPGGGPLLGLPATSPRPPTPSNDPYLWTTPGRTVFKCLSAIDNGSGQGFYAVGSDGTKYWFNHMAQSPAAFYEETWQINNTSDPWNTNPPAAYDSGSFARKKNALYVTRVEDRFGNYVTYSYANAYNQPVKVTSINSSDGRTITFEYNGSNSSLISGVNAGGSHWGYEYGASGLTGVVLPDLTRWTIAFSDFSRANIEYSNSNGTDPNWRSCFRPGPLDDITYTGTITHPSGASGTFAVKAVVFARNNVPAICLNYIPSTASNNYNDPTNDYAIFPIIWHAIALTSKQVTGPSLAPQLWSFSYSYGRSWFLPDGQTEPYKCDSETCAEPKCTSDAWPEICHGASGTTTIVGPEGEWKSYTFGNSYRYNEGKLLATEEGVINGETVTVLRETTKSYDFAQSGQPYPVKIGSSSHPWTDGFVSEYPRPEVSTVITQQGVDFTRAVQTGCVATGAYCLDNFLRPTKVKRSSSTANSIIETTTYFDQMSTWVLGQVSSTAVGNKVVSQTDYDATTALPLRTYSFGLLQQTLTYNADGTVASAKDGRNNVTAVSNWYRGVPRLITYADTEDESATVSGSGRLLSTTDELGYATSYSYDPMDRLTGITYPVGDTVAWNGTTLPFVAVATAEYGIPGGHWKQTIKTGNGQTTTFYDAQWRPVLALTEDTGNAASKSFVVNRYDAGGRLVFSSYPVASLTSVNDTLQGTTTQYDALGRVIKVMQDSELGVLTSTTEYLTGFKTRTTNPRGFKTTTSYQAFDTPDTSRPTRIDAPEGVLTIIKRDDFGKPLKVTRSGPKN